MVGVIADAPVQLPVLLRRIVDARRFGAAVVRLGCVYVVVPVVCGERIQIVEVRLGKHLQDGLTDGIDAVRRNDVVRKLLFTIQRIVHFDDGAVGVVGLGEIAHALQIRRHGLLIDRIRHNLPLKFLVEEEEQFIPRTIDLRQNHRATDHVTGDVITRFDARASGRVREVIVGVQILVAKEPGGSAMELFGAAFCDDVDGRRIAPVLGRVGRHEDFDFGDRIHRRHTVYCGIGTGVQVGHAIDGHVLGVVTAAQDVDSADGWSGMVNRGHRWYRSRPA